MAGNGMKRASNPLVNASALLRVAWAKTITMESIMADCMLNITSLTGQIDPGVSTKLVPGKVIQDVTPQGDDKYSRSVNLEYLQALNEKAKYGSNSTTGVDSIMGNEQQIRVKYFKAYSNDWGTAVSGQRFGIVFRETEPSKVFQHAKPLLLQWWGETEGLFVRQAYCESTSENLRVDPLNLSAEMNANTYVVGSTTPLLQKKDFNTYALYAADVVDNIEGVTGSTTVGHLTVRSAMDLADAAAEAYIKPIPFKGKQLYILYVAAEEFTHLTDPTVVGSFGNSWVAAAAIQDLDKVIPGAEFVIADTIVVCRDRRTPVGHITASGGDSDVTFKYLQPGRVDQRKTVASGQEVWNANVLVGESALVKFHSEPAHYNDQDDMYTKYNNVGFFGACGYMTPVFNDDATPSTPTLNGVQESSMVVFTYSKVIS